jgi:hypothetical protein
MNERGKMMFKLVAFAQILAMILFAACNPSVPNNACHATGDPVTPYEEITITSTNLEEHLGHPNDIYPVPVGGCPTSVVEITNGKITICHVTGSTTKPYNKITVSVSGLNGHGNHAGDIIPAPVAGCPATLLGTNNEKITICHATGSEKNPYNEITVSINGLNGHDQHEGDIIPVPAGGCPTTSP